MSKTILVPGCLSESGRGCESDGLGAHVRRAAVHGPGPLGTQTRAESESSGITDNVGEARRGEARQGEVMLLTLNIHARVSFFTAGSQSILNPFMRPRRH